MHGPNAFREERPEILAAAMRAIGFATLVVNGAEGPEAAHLPLLVRTDAAGGLVLEGHIARSNPLAQLICDDMAGLAMFQGPHAYVHPGWYATKQATGRVVPTWSYVMIEARGTLTTVRDEARLRAHLDELTATHESGRPNGWAVADAPQDYLDALIRWIVGVRMAVTRAEGMWKLSQNQPDANRHGVIAGLSAEEDAGGRAVAVLMRQRG